LTQHGEAKVIVQDIVEYERIQEALTKNDIVKQIQTEPGVLRNKSVEITESLLVVTFKCSGKLRDKINGG
jgi:hypothetical protein